LCGAPPRNVQPLRRAFLLVQGDTHIVLHFGVVGLYRKSRVELGERFVRSPLARERDAQIVVRDQIPRSDRQCMAEERAVALPVIELKPGDHGAHPDDRGTDSP